MEYYKKSSANPDDSIINILHKYNKWLSISSMCHLIGFNEKIFYKNKRKKEYYDFKQIRSNQLTTHEQKVLVKTASNKRLQHLSIKQLQLYSFRNNILHCHYDTWRKYIILFDIQRNNKLNTSKSRKYSKLSSNSSNEFWHIDITFFKRKNGKYLYLQVIQDNYSGLIISWSVKLRKTKYNTIELLSESMNKVTPKYLICDGGGENVNNEVRSLLKDLNILQITSKGSSKRLNLKVEAFFNILKNRYLNKHKHYSKMSLYKTAKSAIKNYNNSPSTKFYGATPYEVYTKDIDYNFLKEELNTKLQYAKIQRKNTYNQEVNHSRTSGS
ncbi:DDE-type integrase/transposase/recombinase [Halobacteriovorax sp. JY17]|uniref:DDE-type integrase/transposase/recombinase n=1 Tax=Halobacteriovorax sp. JY17 TaxID=2014617 RepID=UPI000C6AD752|nr:DDE-type integrase/transposase/recombinase [Halobacteriovorax sp. JY17]PIK15197.1 MAG: hypothetical protein CES88_00360 [Halobacteriovorax sp. JY17]